MLSLPGPPIAALPVTDTRQLKAHKRGKVSKAREDCHQHHKHIRKWLARASISRSSRFDGSPCESLDHIGNSFAGNIVSRS